MCLQSGATPAGTEGHSRPKPTIIWGQPEGGGPSKIQIPRLVPWMGWGPAVDGSTCPPGALSLAEALTQRSGELLRMQVPTQAWDQGNPNSETGPRKQWLFFFPRFYLFIHERHRQREKQAPCREPDVGLNPGTGSCPGQMQALNR